MAEVIVKGESVEKHGPYGNKDGQQWCIMLDTSKSEIISEVIIKSGSIIDSIAFTTVKPTPCGCTYSATHTRFGGNGGSQQHKITLKCGEYITNISGATGDWNGERFVAKLMLHTNLCPEGYGPYGHGMGVANFAFFSALILSGGCVTGFFGTHNKYLNSVGVYGKKAKLVPSMCPNEREVLQISEISSSNKEDESKSPSLLTKDLNDCDLSDVEAEIIRSSARNSRLDIWC